MGDIQQNPAAPRRVMTAALPLQLFSMDESGGGNRKKTAGNTVASRSVDVPRSETWFIEPRQTLTPQDWDTVLGLIREMWIPGLGAPGQITDAVLERLCELDHLTYLDLRDAEVTDAGLRHLARLPALRYLNLSCSHITDRGLEVLQSLPELRTLDLYHQARVSDVGMAHLKSCHHLERVNLMGTRTGDGLIEALAGKARLRQIYAGNLVTDAGMAMLRHMPLFRTPLLRTSTDAPAEMAVASLMSDWAHPTYLWLNLKAPVTDAGLAHFRQLDGLYAVNLFGGAAQPAGVTAPGVGHLAGVPNLGWLGCCGALCTDEAMQHIGNMPGLRFLMCQDAVAGDEGFAAVARSRSIENIWGRRCYHLTARGFVALAEMPLLRGLSVSCKNVDDAGLSALPRFPALRELMPMDVPSPGFRHVGKCTELDALPCMYCPDLTDEATGHIAGLSKLKSFQVWSAPITDGGLEILATMKSLEHLRFYSCAGVTDAGLGALAGLPRLREIDLEKLANVTPEGAAVFPGDVRVNYSV